jgi:hypothetical protein
MIVSYKKIWSGGEVGHLAGASYGPAICVMQGVTDLAFHHAASVVNVNQFQTIRATVFFLAGQQQFGLRMMGALLLWSGRLGNGWP